MAKKAAKKKKVGKKGGGVSSLVKPPPRVKKKASKKKVSKKKASKRGIPKAKRLAAQVDYEAGKLSIPELLSKHGITKNQLDAAIRTYGWQRDLADDIARETRQRAAMLGSDESEEAKDQAMQVAVETNLAIIREHRQVLSEARCLGEQVMAQLRRLTAEVNRHISDEITAMRRQRKEQMKRIQSGERLAKGEKLVPEVTPLYEDRIRLDVLQSVAEVYQRISPALAKYVELERDVFGVKDGDSDDPLTRLVDAITGKSADMNALVVK